MYERWATIPVKTFPIKKRVKLNCLLIESGGFIYKSKGGIGSARSDQEITDLLEEGKSIGGKITYNYLEEKLNMAACLKRLWASKVKNIVAQKEGKWACTMIPDWELRS